MLEQRTYLDAQQWVADTDILIAYQLFHPIYTEIHYQLLQQLLTGIAARSLGREVQVGESCCALAASYLRIYWGFNTDEALPLCISRWLRSEEKELSQE